MVSPHEPGYDALIADIFATIKTATEMNTGYRTPDEVHEYMGRILGKELDATTTVLPPLYIDYGKPVTIGRGGVLHPAMLHVFRTRRHHDRQRCVYRAESQPDYNQPRPEPGEPQRHVRPPYTNRGQGLDRYQFHDTAGRQNRLRSHCGSRQRRNKRRTGDDRRSGQSGTGGQKDNDARATITAHRRFFAFSKFLYRRQRIRKQTARHVWQFSPCVSAHPDGRKEIFSFFILTFACNYQ